MVTTKRFLKDRKKALLSLDRNEIIKYCNKYKIEIPLYDESFWAGIHKARVAALDLPEGERDKSRLWLDNNGYSPDF